MRLMGAVIGDVAGSTYEFKGSKERPEQLVTEKDKFTDDTVLTVAVAAGLRRSIAKVDRDTFLTDEAAQATVKQEIVKWICDYAHRYPNAGYGKRFQSWFEEAYATKVYKPYNSYGNGSAMRAAYGGWLANSLEEALLLGKLSAEVTHDHPEGIKGAQAVTAAIYLLRTGSTKEQVKEYLSQMYDLNFTLDEIRPSYHFDETCQGSVPQAIVCFLEGESFEDVIKNAISLGGDADTLATIAGSLAEVIYPIPADLEKRTRDKLRNDLKAEIMYADKYLNN